MRAPRAILFDLDDTLVAFSAGRSNLWPQALARQAPALATAGRQTFIDAIDQAAAAFWAPAERAARGRLDLVWARRQVARDAFAKLCWPLELADAVADDFTHRKEDAVAPFPGAIARLEDLAARAIPMGLITNGHPSFQRRKIARFGLARFFSVVLIEGEFGVGKPDPSIFRSALKALGAQPRETWMVGDNLQADIAGAQALGIVGVWHDHAGSGIPGDAEVLPDRIIHRVAELM